MKKALLIVIAAFGVALASAQQEETRLNREYQAAIREYLQQDVANRQRSMQQRATQMLVGLPNEQKLYDETYVSIRTDIVEGMKENGERELNYVYDISYNCKHLEGYTDDYPLGVFDWEASNSCRAICTLTKTFVEGLLDDIFRAGKSVSVKIYSTTDGTELAGGIPYDGRYGNFRYCPTVFNGESLRVSVDSASGISNNCQLAYVRAQSVRWFLENKVANLQHTHNDFSFVTRSYADTGAHYRRSSIELTVHDAFRETVELMTADKIQDDYVDFNIPQSTGSYENAYVLILANDDYSNHFLPSVPYADNDGEVVKRYFVKALGVPERQVKLLRNATKATVREEGIDWLTDIAQAVALKGAEGTRPQADIYIYYAGLGFTDFDGTAYLVPDGLKVDKVKALKAKKPRRCRSKKRVLPAEMADVAYDVALSRKDAARLAEQLISVDTLCAWLRAKDRRHPYPVSKLTVILDASFDGNQRSGAPMVRADRKVKADAKGAKAKRKPNKNSDAVVLLAAAYDKTAYGFEAQHHGFLTYFLLKEIKSIAARLENYTYGDIYDEVARRVSKESALQGRWQEISGFVDGKHAADWRQLKLK